MTDGYLTYEMHPEEGETVTFDFSQKAEILAGETLTGIFTQPFARALGAGISALPTLGTGAISGATVTCSIDASTAQQGQDYELYCTVTTNSTPPHHITVGGKIQVRNVVDDA